MAQRFLVVKWFDPKDPNSRKRPWNREWVVMDIHTGNWTTRSRSRVEQKRHARELNVLWKNNPSLFERVVAPRPRLSQIVKRR